MEPYPVLKVSVNTEDLGSDWIFFYTKMLEDGHIHIRGLPLLILQGEKPSFVG
jgi:hypothetical protein